MRDARRRREIRDYYLGISADEITSYLTPASFDLWESVARYRRELGIGARWLEVGGGVGDLAATALERGYDVMMTDVQSELLEAGAARHPRLRGRLQRSDVFDARDVAALAAGGPLSICADILHVLPGFADLARLTRSWELDVLETHSLYHRYPPTPTYNAEFDERMLRLFLRKRQAGRPAPVRASRRARPGSRRPGPSPSRDPGGARRATRRRPRA